MVDGKIDHWLPYVCGCTVALAVHPADEPFTRGAPYVWCKRIRENGNVMFPTAPLFGRFIEQAGSRPKVLSGAGQSEVVGAEYVHCFRAVGVLGSERQFFPRSEVPTPVPSKGERLDGPAAFDLLQNAAKQLDRLLREHGRCCGHGRRVDRSGRESGRGDSTPLPGTLRGSRL
jgi:hypothetical protein